MKRSERAPDSSDRFGSWVGGKVFLIRAKQKRYSSEVSWKSGGSKEGSSQEGERSRTRTLGNLLLDVSLIWPLCYGQVSIRPDFLC